MAEPFIIAEAAQGYEGSAEVARLLVRAAAAAGADAVKFQIVFADDLAVPGYQYYDLFRALEMSFEEWKSVRDEAERRGVAFYADILGPRSAELAAALRLDGAKIHSTCFFENELIAHVLDTIPTVLLSVGGIEPAEAVEMAKRYRLAERGGVTVMYGYQAEPTPLDQNNLARIPAMREMLGLDVGFMDHVDGSGPDVITLSAVALGLGVTRFEKHITLDRTLEMEDFPSALGVGEFSGYVQALRRLAGAVGSPALELVEAERTYRGRALKRLVAARDLSAGHTIQPGDVVLLRPAQPAPEAMLQVADAVGRGLRVSLARHTPITTDMLA